MYEFSASNNNKDVLLVDIPLFFHIDAESLMHIPCPISSTINNTKNGSLLVQNLNKHKSLFFFFTFPPYLITGSGAGAMADFRLAFWHMVSTKLDYG